MTYEPKVVQMNRTALPSKFTSESGVQILLVDFARLLVPAVMGEQGQITGGNSAHLHCTGRPLHGVEVVKVLVEDEGRRPAVRRAVGGVREPALLRHRVPGKEDLLQMLLRKRLGGEDLPYFSLAGRAGAVAFGNLHRGQRAQALDVGGFVIQCEDIGKEEVFWLVCGAQKGHIEQTVDQRGHCLVVTAREVGWNGWRKAWEVDLRHALLERCGNYNYVIQGMGGTRLTNVVHLIEICY